MRTIPRSKIRNKTYREILDVEIHHDHEIIEDEQGKLRWKENPRVSKMIDKIGMNDIVMLLYSLGYDKNSEPYRKIYRDIGYSLYGYWEIFYWGVNNDIADEYRPTVSVAFKKQKKSKK